MAPPGVLPSVRPGEPLERGQTTIFSSLNRGLAIQRPPRPSPTPKAAGQANTVLGRRLIGGTNERQVLELFASVRLTQADNAEPGDVELVNRGTIEEEDDDYEYTPSKRYSYSHEHKLATIDYFQTTWKELEDRTYERLSVRYASKRLKVTCKMLRDWVASKERIQAQKRGTKRSCKSISRPQEPELERQLNDQFEKAREKGRQCLQQYAQYGIAQYRGSAIRPQYSVVNIVSIQYVMPYIVLLAIY